MIIKSYPNIRCLVGCLRRLLVIELFKFVFFLISPNVSIINAVVTVRNKQFACAVVIKIHFACVAKAGHPVAAFAFSRRNAFITAVAVICGIFGANLARVRLKLLDSAVFTAEFDCNNNDKQNNHNNNANGKRRNAHPFVCADNLLCVAQILNDFGFFTAFL